MDPRLKAAAEAAKGFMPEDEGLALYEAGLKSPGKLLEIGTYCGKSSIYLGAAAREIGTVLFTVDHHRGSEEMGPEWQHHDPEVVDPRTGRMDSLPFFRRNIEDAGLEDVVIGIIGDSDTVGALWEMPLGLLFIDGGHSPDIAMNDYDNWVHNVQEGGILAIHDVFEDPAEGGRGPFRVYEKALTEGFTEIGRTGSLRTLRR